MPRRPATTPVRLGDRLDVEVEAMADGPDGLARIGGYVVLVPGVLPGERVRVEMTSAARKFGRGRLLDVLRPSAARTTARCRHFLRCGGCDLQHAEHGAQVATKRAALQKALQHALGDAAPAVGEVRMPGAPWAQRHKVVLHIDGAGSSLIAGFHRRRSPVLVPVRECPAADPDALALAFAAVEALRGLRVPRGVLRAVLVRRAAGTGEAHVVVVAARALPGLDRVADELRARGATAVSLNVNDGPAARLLGPRTETIAGPPRIRERIGDVDYLVSPTSFFQTSPAAAAALVDEVLCALAPSANDDVLDLYCGAGLLALPLARHARRVLGVEASRAALGDAAAAARENGIENVDLRAGRVERVLPQLQRAREEPALVALDPPRAGCAPDVPAAIAALRPRRVAYVSCDVAALARDLRAFAGVGYRAHAVVPVEMFPQTCKLEAVAVLGRGERRGA